MVMNEDLTLGGPHTMQCTDAVSQDRTPPDHIEQCGKIEMMAGSGKRLFLLSLLITSDKTHSA